MRNTPTCSASEGLQPPKEMREFREQRAQARMRVVETAAAPRVSVYRRYIRLLWSVAFSGSPVVILKRLHRQPQPSPQLQTIATKRMNNRRGLQTLAPASTTGGRGKPLNGLCLLLPNLKPSPVAPTLSKLSSQKEGLVTTETLIRKTCAIGLCK